MLVLNFDKQNNDFALDFAGLKITSRHQCNITQNE